MNFKTWLITTICLITISTQAQNILLGEKDTSKINPNLTPIEVFTDNEIRMMDSMLNIWYVKNELSNKQSVLSKLKDDTTAYENNDSLIYHRLKNIVTEVPLAYNSKVKRFIELYAVQRQRSSSVILGLAQYYYPWMKAIFDKYDVPEEIVYVTIIESALNPNAVSPAGATGIWQFMYGTGKMYGLEVDTYVDDRRDPYKATDAAARHFRDLYNIFHDWGLAISAYNCGTGNVRKAIQRSGGKTDFWGVCPYLPKETQNYFPAYIGALYMMNYHDQYGIHPATITIPTSVDTVMVNKEMNFQQIASVLNINIEEIKSLNPQYKREVIPAHNCAYPLRLRTNDIVRFIAMEDSIAKYHYNDYFTPAVNHTALASTATTQTASGTTVQATPNKYHYVRSGETLSKIASKYHTSVTTLKSLNHLHSSSLRVGQKLLVKKGTTVYKPAPTTVVKDSTTTVKDSTLMANNTQTQQAKPETTTAKPTTTQAAERVHIVNKGDTLSSIGKRYGKTAMELANYNHLKNVNSIQVGQKIRIPR